MQGVKDVAVVDQGPTRSTGFQARSLIPIQSAANTSARPPWALRSSTKGENVVSNKRDRHQADTKDHALDRRKILLGGTTLAAASALGTGTPTQLAQAQAQPAPSGRKPNILF